MTSACIGEPISWLRLERVAAGTDDATVSAHLASCEACRHCLDEIRRDVVALPVLHVVEKRRWWTFAIPAVMAAAAVVAILFVMRPRDDRAVYIARVKGVGQVELDVVRDRDGVIRDDVRSFVLGDRWKVIVTCPPNANAWIDVAVVELGAERADYPVAPAQIACGNRVVIPGAFTLTGAKRHRVCARVGASAPPPRGVPHEGDEDVACVTISPEGASSR
jgi:hypothetical protein